jgi:hypothetical protein
MALARDWAHACHVCNGTELTLPHLHRDWAHPFPKNGSAESMRSAAASAACAAKSGASHECMYRNSTAHSESA